MDYIHCWYFTSMQNLKGALICPYKGFCYLNLLSALESIITPSVKKELGVIKTLNCMLQIPVNSFLSL